MKECGGVAGDSKEQVELKSNSVAERTIKNGTAYGECKWNLSNKWKGSNCEGKVEKKEKKMEKMKRKSQTKRSLPWYTRKELTYATDITKIIMETEYELSYIIYNEYMIHSSNTKLCFLQQNSKILIRILYPILSTNLSNVYNINSQKYISYISSTIV